MEGKKDASVTHTSGAGPRGRAQPCTAAKVRCYPSIPRPLKRCRNVPVILRDPHMIAGAQVIQSLLHRLSCGAWLRSRWEPRTAWCRFGADSRGSRGRFHLGVDSGDLPLSRSLSGSLLPCGSYRLPEPQCLSSLPLVSQAPRAASWARPFPNVSSSGHSPYLHPRKTWG